MFKLIEVIYGWDTFYEIAQMKRLMSLETLGEDMTWCRQATSYYLNQFWLDQCRHMTSLSYNELMNNDIGFSVWVIKVYTNSVFAYPGVDILLWRGKC